MACAVVAIEVSGVRELPISSRENATAVQDADGDGLDDEVEAAGWRTSVGDVITTDPRNFDSDADGLQDGLEAGPATIDAVGRPIHSLIANPKLTDSDLDGISDAEEYYTDIDPRSPDTDGDGVFDQLEVNLGSDPTSANPDGDEWTDAEEVERGLNPTGYDLTRGESLGAFAIGTLAGNWSWGARELGRLNDAQLQSPEYLAGQVVSGFLGFGDVRDAIGSAVSLDLVDTALSAMSITPGPGDVARVATLLIRFRDRGPNAERSVDLVIGRLPWSKEAKRSLQRRVFGPAARLPAELGGGARTYVVYVGRGPDGSGYVGITNDFARRSAEHRVAGREFVPRELEGAGALTRGEARAIEQACIVRGRDTRTNPSHNKINSIDPKHPYYDDAVAFGSSRIQRQGTCW